MNILQLLQGQFNSFSEKDKIIATYILQNGNTINNMSITTLAEIVHVSPATLTRFVKKMQCDSFVDFKMKLNADYPENNHPADGELSKDVYQYYNKVIENTRINLNQQSIDEVVKLISNASKISIFGVGSSGLTAMELAQRLLRMGLNVMSTTDSHQMMISSSITSEKDLVIGISTSGNTPEVVNALHLAKNSGAKTVAITSFSDSNITKYTSNCLISYSSLFINQQRFINSQFSNMYVIDLITTLLLENDDFDRYMNRTIEVITEALD